MLLLKALYTPHVVHTILCFAVPVQWQWKLDTFDYRWGGGDELCTPSMHSTLSLQAELVIMRLCTVYVSLGKDFKDILMPQDGMVESKKLAVTGSRI